MKGCAKFKKIEFHNLLTQSWLLHFRPIFQFYSPEHIRKPVVFWHFQGLKKGILVWNSLKAKYSNLNWGKLSKVEINPEKVVLKKKKKKILMLRNGFAAGKI